MRCAMFGIIHGLLFDERNRTHDVTDATRDVPMAKKTDLFCETYLILLSLQMYHSPKAAYVSHLQNGDVQNQ